MTTLELIEEAVSDYVERLEDDGGLDAEAEELGNAWLDLSKQLRKLSKDYHSKGFERIEKIENRLDKMSAKGLI